MGYDPSGEFFFTLLGAATGFIGSAAVSLLQGNDISKAVHDGVAGAVGGAVAGLAVDSALVIAGTGGAAAPFLAFGAAYLGGGVGNCITTYFTSDGKASTDEYIASFIIGGTFNAISLGTSWDCAAKTFKGVAIKAALNTTENEIVGTCTALAAGVATHIGTTIARECNRVQVGAVRRAVQ